MKHRFKIKSLIVIFLIAILGGLLLYTYVLPKRSQSTRLSELNHSKITMPDLEKRVTAVDPSPPSKGPKKQVLATNSKADSDFMSFVEEEQEKEVESAINRLNLLSSLPPVRDKAKTLFSRNPQYGHFDISLSDDGQFAAFMEAQSADSKLVSILVYSFEDDKYINVTQDFGNSEVMHPYISPDGRNVVFRENEIGIWIIDLKTMSPTLIIDNPEAHKPSFSSDGRHITYNVFDPISNRVGFQVYDIEQKRIVKSYPGDDDTSVYYASISPDGTHLLYKQMRYGNNGHDRSLILESFDTGKKQTIRIPHQEFSYARMSPDGKYIAYSAVSNTTNSEEIFCFNLKDQKTTQITSGNGKLPVWIAGSQHLAFMSSREKGVPGIYVIDIMMEDE